MPLKWIGIGVVAILAIGALSGRNNPPSVPVATPIPEQQRSFLEVTKAFAEKSASATNDLQRSALREERKALLRQSLDGRREISGWLGTIREISSTSDGRAVAAVRLSPNTEIHTWNNQVSDLLDETLIAKDSTLYKSLVGMSSGDEVTVSGSFASSDDDWIRETSITLDGSLRSPEFLFHFHKIAKR